MKKFLLCLVIILMLSCSVCFAQDSQPNGAIVTEKGSYDVREYKFKKFPILRSDTKDKNTKETLENYIAVKAVLAKFKNGKTADYIAITCGKVSDAGPTVVCTAYIEPEEYKLVSLRLSDLLRIFKARNERKTENYNDIEFHPTKTFALFCITDKTDDGKPSNTKFALSSLDLEADKLVSFISFDLLTLGKVVQQFDQCAVWLDSQQRRKRRNGLQNRR